MKYFWCNYLWKLVTNLFMGAAILKFFTYVLCAKGPCAKMISIYSIWFTISCCQEYRSISAAKLSLLVRALDHKSEGKMERSTLPNIKSDGEIASNIIINKKNWRIFHYLSYLFSQLLQQTSDPLSGFSFRTKHFLFLLKCHLLGRLGHVWIRFRDNVILKHISCLLKQKNNGK